VAVGITGQTPTDGVERPRNPFTAWRIATYTILIALALSCWLVSDLRMSGMDNGPGTDLGTIGFYLSTWVVMMAAMMFPSVAPMIATYVGIQNGRRRKAMPAPVGATACFVAGYLITWTGFGVVAYLLIRSGSALTGDALSWDRGGRWFAATVLVIAAVYELTPLKRACLSRCRGPLTFILTSWRNGRFGALRMGGLHGAWCVGCCWALMAALFALGVMSLAWMALIGVLIAVEKLLPWRRVATVAVTGVLVLLAIGVAATPDRLPGLTVPVQHMSMDAPQQVR
jgi:predicted metal-binding membrane protein